MSKETTILKQISDMDTFIRKYDTHISKPLSNKFFNMSKIEHAVGHSDETPDIDIIGDTLLLIHGIQTGYDTTAHKHEVSITPAILQELHRVYDIVLRYFSEWDGDSFDGTLDFNEFCCTEYGRLYTQA